MQRKDFIVSHIQKVDGSRAKSGFAKHQKMLRSPFVFYRGSAQLFYADIAENVLNVPKAFNDLPLVCVMGDCHASNFGFLTEEGSHGDTVIFAPNDFDDACVGHASWDLLRYLVSLLLAADHCQGVVQGRYSTDDEYSGKTAVTIANAMSAMSAFLDGYLAVCQQVYTDPSVVNQAMDYEPEGKLAKPYRKACRRAAGGRDFGTKSALAKAVELQQGRFKFRHREVKFVKLDPAAYETLEQTFAPYMDDPILDIVGRANAGTGSVNMARYYFLVGPNLQHDMHSFERCHIVEVKQQRAAAPLSYFMDLCPVNRLNPAHLTARCQRKMQRRPDLLLDEVEWNESHWLIRSRHHAKVGLDPEDVGISKRSASQNFSDFARYCGMTLALAHCRSDRRSTTFEQSIVELIQAHQHDLMTEAQAYFEQVLKDFQLFSEWVSSH